MTVKRGLYLFHSKFSSMLHNDANGQMLSCFVILDERAEVAKLAILPFLLTHKSAVANYKDFVEFISVYKFKITLIQSLDMYMSPSSSLPACQRSSLFLNAQKITIHAIKKEQRSS